MWMTPEYVDRNPWSVNYKPYKWNQSEELWALQKTFKVEERKEIHCVAIAGALIATGAGDSLKVHVITFKKRGEWNHKLLFAEKLPGRIAWVCFIPDKNAPAGLCLIAANSRRIYCWHCGEAYEYRLRYKEELKDQDGGVVRHI